jgi:hypothetical protein
MVGYEADLTDESDAWLRLHYRADGEPLDYRIRLVTTAPTYGGRRWWFICPLSREDGGPPRRYLATRFIVPRREKRQARNTCVWRYDIFEGLISKDG